MTGHVLTRVEHIMGTAISIQIADPLPSENAERILREAFEWLRGVDRRFSTYRGDSEVNRLDRGDLRFSDCSADMRHVLDACADLWRATDGWFDTRAAGRLDPSGYVKGWAVQVASDLLLAAGANNHCVNAGGDVRVRGSPAGGPPRRHDAADGWRVGIRHPWRRAHVAWVLTARDHAIATSGTYERGHHVIDPFRGEPARGLCSATVVGTDLGLADAYATAAVAMGEAGLRWLDELPGYEWAVITDEGDAYRSRGLSALERGAGQDGGRSG